MKYTLKVTFKKLLTQVLPTSIYNTAFFVGKDEMKAAGAYRELLSETELLSVFFDKQKTSGFYKIKPIVRDTNLDSPALFPLG